MNFFIFGFVLSFANAFVKFLWIKECLDAKHLFQLLANLPVRGDVYYYCHVPLRLTCSHRHWFVHMGVSFYRHSSQKLVQANISFSLSWPAQTKPSTGTFSNPHKITYPYKQTFTFLCRSLHFFFSIHYFTSIQISYL